MSQELYIIDAHSSCYRLFYAIPPLSSPSGVPTNTVLGFTKIIEKILEKDDSGYIAVVFDSPGPTLRQQEFAEYKAGRKPMPDDLYQQIPLIKDLLSHYKAPVFGISGYEADDIIATLASRAATEGRSVNIITSDKDLKQLLTDSVRIIDSRTQKTLTRQDFIDDYGFEPQRFIDYQALTGDSTDNIPGVKGIGDKTARKLIAEYETLDNVYDHLEKIKPRWRNLLEADRENAYLTRKLATLDRDVPVDANIESLRIQPPDTEKLLDTFKQLGLKSLMKKYAAAATRQPELKYTILENRAAIEEALENITGRDRISFVLNGDDAPGPQSLPGGVSFFPGSDTCIYVPILRDDKVLAKMLKTFFESGTALISASAKRDYILLANMGIDIDKVNIHFDGIIASYLMNPDKNGYSIHDLTMSFLGMETEFTEAENPQPDARSVCTDSCRLARALYELPDKVLPELKNRGLDALYADVEIPLARTLARMEVTGVKVDPQILKTMSEELAAILGELKEEIYRASDEEFNLNSPKQLSKVLYEKLELPALKKTKTGISTNEETLKKLSALHPVPKLIIEYRSYEKVKSTYVDVLPTLISKKTGCIHASFNQVATATGRLSSSNPNMQNIPVRSQLGRNIRRAFQPRNPHSLYVTADYSQIELRILAHLSQDPELLEAFRNDRDVHTFVASRLYDIPQEDISDSQRKNAKTVNFGIVYGQSAYGLSAGTGMTVAEADNFLKRYFETYPGVTGFVEETVRDATERGYVRTMLGRVRPVPQLHSARKNTVNLGRRIAVNTVVQGSAADLIKIAMNRIYTDVREKYRACLLIMQIHDELVFEVPEKMLDEFSAMIREKMEGAMSLDIPLKVNIASGKNWMEA